MIDTIVEDAQRLPFVPVEAAREYAEKAGLLIDAVNRDLESDHRLPQLIGRSALDVMHTNHANHAAFMANVFSLGLYGLLAQTVPWVYRSYHARGFSYAYFPVELDAWIRAAERHLSPSATPLIVAVYRWMIQQHETMIALADQEPPPARTVDGQWEATRRRFMASLLSGDLAGALATAREGVQPPKSLEGFFLQVIQPSMYEVGRLWERGKISVAQEHLASSIVGRIMAGLYANLARAKPTKGKAVITTAPNEFHELGAWMVADLLECDGWQVSYLGANTPVDDLLSLLLQVKPNFLGMSVTMPFNLDRATLAVRALRKDPDLAHVRIMMGGNVFNVVPTLWQKLGGDGCASDAGQAVILARQWHGERTVA